MTTVCFSCCVAVVRTPLILLWAVKTCEGLLSAASSLLSTFCSLWPPEYGGGVHFDCPFGVVSGSSNLPTWLSDLLPLGALGLLRSCACVTLDVFVFSMSAASTVPPFFTSPRDGLTLYLGIKSPGAVVPVTRPRFGLAASAAVFFLVVPFQERNASIPMPKLMIPPRTLRFRGIFPP